MSDIRSKLLSDFNEEDSNKLVEIIAATPDPTFDMICMSLGADVIQFNDPSHTKKRESMQTVLLSLKEIGLTFDEIASALRMADAENCIHEFEQYLKRTAYSNILDFVRWGETLANDTILGSTRSAKYSPKDANQGYSPLDAIPAPAHFLELENHRVENIWHQNKESNEHSPKHVIPGSAESGPGLKPVGYTELGNLRQQNKNLLEMWTARGEEIRKLQDELQLCREHIVYLEKHVAQLKNPTPSTNDSRQKFFTRENDDNEFFSY